jgi:hypothetical protein
MSPNERAFTCQFFFSADFLFAATLLRPVSNAQQDGLLMAYFGLFPFSFLFPTLAGNRLNTLIFLACRHRGKARCDIRHVSYTNEPSSIRRNSTADKIAREFPTSENPDNLPQHTFLVQQDCCQSLRWCLLWLSLPKFCSYFCSVSEKERKETSFHNRFFKMTLAVSAAPTGHTATVTPICTAEITSPEFLNESCEVFDSYGKREYPIDHEQDENNPATVWHLLSTIYIPLVFLRLRKTFFGLFSFMGSILFGQFFQYHLSYLSPATWDTLAPWLELINAKDLHGKRDAWPPPTLKLLAIFTIVAFIVHPDGMTWVVLGKLRYESCVLVSKSVLDIV